MVLIMDGQTPKGRVLKPRIVTQSPTPCITRKMTAEEREKYNAIPPQEEKPPAFARMLHAKHENPHDPDFGKKVQEERERRGMSIREMAKLTGLSATTISNIENCRYGIKPATRKIVSDALGWEV